MYKIFQTLLLLIFIVGCHDSADSSLQANLILRNALSQESSSFVQGETIDFFLTITNKTDELITLNFSDGQQYDFYITSSSGAEVWRWSGDKVFMQALTQLMIPAQGTVEVIQVWDQMLLVGGNLAIGSYIAFGSFLDQSPTGQFGFTVQ